jgi:carnosine N-methyltransferase
METAAAEPHSAAELGGDGDAHGRPPLDEAE